MKLIVGLGNPGEKYKNNRHNVGHMFVDFLEEYQKLEIKDQNDKVKLKILKTTVYMNQSGIEIKKHVKRYSLNVVHDLIIVHDDLDIPLGKFKIQQGEGPRLHNGINSIEEILKSKDFWRIRIGVDNRTQDKWVEGERYVLSNFYHEEKEILTQLFPKIYIRLKSLV